jgi:transcriptional regulator with XRE-family HTH domain
MKIKINVKEIRDSKNITLEELSQKADVDIKELENFENGNINIKFNNAVKIAYALNVELTDLYKIEEY